MSAKTIEQRADSLRFAHWRDLVRLLNTLETQKGRIIELREKLDCAEGELVTLRAGRVQS